jgi:hypothetical protein
MWDAGCGVGLATLRNPTSHLTKIPPFLPSTEMIVERMSNDMVLIMAGYEDRLTEMLRKMNPGLSSRMNAHDPFRFADYDFWELLEIFSRLCDKNGIYCPFKVKRMAINKLMVHQEDGIVSQNFGNARRLEALFATAQARMMDRVLSLEESEVNGRRELTEGKKRQLLEEDLHLMDEDIPAVYYRKNVAMAPLCSSSLESIEKGVMMRYSKYLNFPSRSPLYY